MSGADWVRNLPFKIIIPSKESKLRLVCLICFSSSKVKGFPGGSDGKESPSVQETLVQFLSWEDPLEKGIATHSSILAWRILWTEEPVRLQLDTVCGVTKSQTCLSDLLFTAARSKALNKLGLHSAGACTRGHDLMSEVWLS